MKLTVRIAVGERFPAWAGLVRHDFERHECVCALLGLNWLMRLAWIVFVQLKKPFGWWGANAEATHHREAILRGEVERLRREVSRLYRTREKLDQLFRVGNPEIKIKWAELDELVR
jgi:hypothetical protein